jgi:DivIVA domain-containing protein
MGQFLLLVVVALTVGAVVFGVTVLLTGGDGGLSPAEPDGQAVPLPGTRPLAESDIARVRFDVTARGYRMAQVDQAMRRAAYDIGYKDELINVLEAEVDALRSGRFSDAEVLRRAREAAQATTGGAETAARAPGSAEGDQELTTINLGEVAKAPEPATPRAEQPAAGTGQPDTAEAEQPAGAEADHPTAVEAEQPASEKAVEPVADQTAEEPATDKAGEPAADKAEEPTAPRADAGSGGSDQPESDTIMPSRR